ncbi:lysozyme [Paraburkholderia antibiotica]|uniref:Lysozyme n=1 Tax=Paraburkholderia antibiotica TaxID=2728839 RepID=A0A7Y0FFV2_9BURK|nr:lysozyme [Paraburkholderia antibiotica]NML34503.1 lysozyme [Paraburkholderia antibiotica]
MFSKLISFFKSLFGGGVATQEVLDMQGLQTIAAEPQPPAATPVADAPQPAGAPVATVPTWIELCRPLVQHFENCYLTAYPDPGSALAKVLQGRGLWQKTLNGAAIPADLQSLSGAPWTCGWGSTGTDVKQGTVWTQAFADARLDAQINEAAAAVDRAVKVALAPREKAALTSIVYNVGPGRAAAGNDQGRDGIVVLASGKPSTLLSKLNAGDKPGAADQFPAWNKSGGVVSNGLVRRRAAERSLFLTGTWSTS